MQYTCEEYESFTERNAITNGVVRENTRYIRELYQQLGAQNLKKHREASGERETMNHKIDWTRKLTSRKFWLSIASFVTMLLIALGKSEATATHGEGLADGHEESTVH